MPYSMLSVTIIVMLRAQRSIIVIIIDSINAMLSAAFQSSLNIIIVSTIVIHH